MKQPQKLTFSINPLTIIIILLVVIVGMFAMWRPWEGKTDRTITITGQAEVKGTPDEFTFSPYFQRTGSDSAKLKTELDTFGTKLLADLVKLGVGKDDVTLNSNSYDKQSTEPVAPDGKPTANSENTVTLSVSIKVPNKELAQKVQDYLSTTDAEGQLTSMPNFSKETRQKLEDEAREKAAKNAREKAERTAKNLGGSVGKVVTIKDSGSSSPVYPMMGIAEDSSTRSSLPVTPGQDTISLSVEVVFELR